VEETGECGEQSTRVEEPTLLCSQVENTLRDAADQMAEIPARQQFLKTNLQYRNGKLDDLDWSFLA
jgi:hypothetical protein